MKKGQSYMQGKCSMSSGRPKFATCAVMLSSVLRTTKCDRRDNAANKKKEVDSTGPLSVPVS